MSRRITYNRARKYTRKSIVPSIQSSRFIFMTRFEEKKTYEYLINTITSGFLLYKPFNLIYFSSDVLGEATIVSHLKKIRPRLPEGETYEEWIEEEELHKKIPKKVAIKCLREEILPALNKKLQRLANCSDNELQKRLLNIQKTFKLTDKEADILFFYYLLCISTVLGKHLSGSHDFPGSSSIISFDSFLRFKNYGHHILGINRHSLNRTLSRGTLFRIQLLRVNEDNSALEINDWCRYYLSGVGKSNLEHDFFTKANDSLLEISDFDLPKDELLVLHDLLQGKGRCNILFYGAPGTGKTSLAKTLARVFKKELLTVKVPEDDERKNRLLAIHATINLADKDDSIILIDEADEILNTHGSFYYFSAKGMTNKSWINNIIDNHDKKIIWITNRTDEIDTATMRRFSFSFEFKKLTAKNRRKVLQHELRKKKGLEGYFTEDELSDLCNNYSVDASGIVNAINVSKINRNCRKETVLNKIRAVLKSHEKAIGEKKITHSNNKTLSHYSLEGLNTSRDLNEIITIIKQHSEGNGHAHTTSLSLLLYGRPGTGKTEFVHYLGNLLGKDIVLKRCSELQSMWVGETEKNIANAFREAQENNSILFFDEADSFLYPRSSAHRSWEVSFTNEMLSQLDSFSGIAIFATNDIDGLDHAAMRRFKFKIEFRPLTSEGNLRFYDKLLRPLISGEVNLSSEVITQIKSIRNLTPGDFSVVRDQFLFVKPASVTHQKLIDSLNKESSHKKGEGEILGFGERV